MSDAKAKVAMQTNLVENARQAYLRQALVVLRLRAELNREAMKLRLAEVALDGERQLLQDLKAAATISYDSSGHIVIGEID